MKRLLSIFIVFVMLLSFMPLGVSPVYAAEEYAWVLVDTYKFPIPEYFKAGSFWVYSAKFEGNTAEVRTTATEKNPPDLHARYTWSNPPNVIKSKEKVTIRMEQEVISDNVSKYLLSFKPFFVADAGDMKLGYGTSSSRNAKGVYEDGEPAVTMILSPGYMSTNGRVPGGDESFQKSTWVDLSLEFFEGRTVGDKKAIYLGVYAGSPGSLGTRYTYEWKKVESNIITPTPASIGNIQDLTGKWDINGNGYKGNINITNQSGSEFIGTVNYNGEKTNNLTNGSIKGDQVSFTRQWVDSSFNQVYTGTLTISDGIMTMKGTFTSSGSTYNWIATKKVKGTPAPAPTPKPTPTPTPAPTPAPTPSKNNAEAFASGARIMWSPANGLGYRLFRSTNQSELGISVTDFYITSMSYADVNVESNTTYYYTVKPVLAEAKPFEGIDEKLGNTIATFTITTGNEVYKPGSFKHFIMLKLESPNMSVDGVNQEVDPGRGTMPLVIAGRTMVPIRAIVEAMGGTAEWDGNTNKITLKARGNLVEMWLGKTEIKVNGQNKKMDIAPTSKNGRTFVPLRFAAENLNCKVDWINSTKEAVIVYEE